jgi:GntR family transcriptional regulator/MocR family aminotransferase
MDYVLMFAEYAREVQGSADARVSRQQRLYACLRAAILRGTIAPGTQLPASRVLAQELGVARNSVLYAYEQLAAEGFVSGSRQGTVVADVGLALHGHAKAQAQAQALAHDAHRPRLSRRASNIGRPADDHSDSDDEPRAFVPGLPALEVFPMRQWRRCLERAWRSADSTRLDFMSLGGHLALREAIANYVRVSRGVRCDASHVVVTDGTQSSLDLCARTLADAGDTAWMEDPGYGGAQAAFQCADLRVVPVPVDADGLAPHPTLWQEAPPKLIYITPSHQYPLGSVMSLERRLMLLQAASACGAWIIEDDYDSEFRHHGTPLASLQGLAPDAPVVYLGTFSKVMFPALRIAFIVAPPALAHQLVKVASRLMPMGRLAEQIALAEFIDSGNFTQHLRRMRKLYGERREALLSALQRHMSGLLTVSAGAGGMHLSARLDVPVDDVAVSKAARAHRLTMRPLSPFCIGEAARGAYNGFVLGYGAVGAQHMDAAVLRMRGVIEAMAGEN